MDRLHRLVTQSPEMSRRELDLAVGAVMGFRQCSERDAFDDIVGAVHQTRLGLSTVAHALLTILRGSSDGSADPGALDYWRHAWALHDPAVASGGRGSPHDDEVR